MNLTQIEQQVLHLPEQERAALVHKILISLETLSAEELEQDWMIEAGRRAVELDTGAVQPVPADEVRRKAQALLR